MAVQLQITLPLDWASDFDRVAERWYFFHRPSGFCQYPLPKAGDEITHAAELVPRLPPRPIGSDQNSTTTPKMAMYVGQDKSQSMVTTVELQQTQWTAPGPTVLQMPQTQVSSVQHAQQGLLNYGNTPQQNGPVAVPDPLRRASGSVTRKPLRKPLPRQNSAPVQQQSQPPATQTHDSQISPRTSISGNSTADVQTKQQYSASSWSSTSQTSFQDSLLPASHPQSVFSPRSSISQNSVLEAPLQRTVSEPIPTMQAPQQPYNSQYASPIVQSPGITPIPEWTGAPIESSPSASFKNQGVSSVSSWAEEFEESPRSSTQFQSSWSTSSRPKLANRLSTSAINLTKKSIEVSKKSYEASKGYVKAHPGKTTAIAGGIVGGIGVVANACGADGLSDAVAASKVYLNVKRAQQRKRVSHGVPHGTAHNSAATTAQSGASAPVTHGPSAQEVAHELFKMMHQQGQLPSIGQNTAPQNNGQPLIQAAPSNAPFQPQQYFQQQYTQPQLVPQPLFVQPDPSTINPLFTLPSAQAQPQTPDPSILSYQPPASPTPSIPTDPLTQCPTPPLSLSDPSSPLSLPFNTLSISPDPSTLNYDQFLQDQTTNEITNQAILNSQAFTTSITGQDMFVPDDLTVDNCSDGESDCGDAYSF